MIKMAMVKVQDAMKKGKYRSRMILQVHDELVFDAYKDEAEELRALVLENMQSALPLPNGVPVIAEAGVGNNWLEAH
jgi:DNA polymerase-1